MKILLFPYLSATWLPKLPEKNKNGQNLLSQGVLPTSNIAVKTLSAVNQSSVPCPNLSTTTTVDFVDVKTKGRGETNRSNSTLLLEPELKTEFKSRAEKRKLTTDINTISGSAKQRKLDDSNHPVSNVEYRRGMFTVRRKRSK